MPVYQKPLVLFYGSLAYPILYFNLCSFSRPAARPFQNKVGKLSIFIVSSQREKPAQSGSESMNAATPFFIQENTLLFSPRHPQVGQNQPVIHIEGCIAFQQLCRRDKKAFLQLIKIKGIENYGIPHPLTTIRTVPAVTASYPDFFIKFK